MSSRKILVFQHVPFEPLGTLDPLLRDAGFRIRYVNFSRDPNARPSLDGYAGLIILGGPMNTDQVNDYPNLTTELALIREALDKNLHVLGICLGAQLLAKALGGAVSKGAVKEIGWHPVTTSAQGHLDPLLSALGNEAMLFHWHGDQISLPPNCKLLAQSEHCEVQAFSYADQAYGLQFHLEVDEPLIERWLTVPVNVEELATVSDYVDPHMIRHDIRHHLPAMQDLSHELFSRWAAKIAPARKRKTRLPSR